ncbi:MAG: pitrilysin family protein [Candidatus Krumholzibacteriia bacterium]
MQRIAATLLALLVLAAAAPGQVLRQLDAIEAEAAATAARAERQPVFTAPPVGAEVLRLENGLEVVLLPNPSQPMVGVYTQVKVGSAWEDFATSGMSHMLEHLLFNGTDRYTQDELYAAADRLGAYNNAHTTDFYTDFMMVLPAEQLEQGLELQSQMLFHSLLPQEKFAKEQDIVLGELAMSRDRGDPYFEETLRQAMYGGSSLALPTLGTSATIAALDRDATYAFYKAWYVPNNMILTVAGRFDRDQTLTWLQEYYGEVAPRSVPVADLTPARPLVRTETLSRRGGGQRMAALVFAAPARGESDEAAFQLATQLLTADGSGILTRALEDLPEADRPSLAAWWQAAPGFARYVLEFTLTPTSDPDQLYGLVQNALAGALDAGLPADDLRAAVAGERTATLKQREQLRMTGIYIAEPLVLGGPDALLGHLDRIRAVTPESAAAALRTWLVDQPCLALLVEPEAADTGIAPLDAARLDRSVLPGGAVLVTQTDPYSELLAVHLTVRDRAGLDQRAGEPGALNLVHRLLTTGVAGCDAACLARRLGAIGAEIKLVDDPRFPMDDYYTTGRYSFLRLECPAEDAPEALALLVELVQYSTFTAEDLERERRDQERLLARRETSATARSQQLLREGLYGDHPLAQEPEGTTASVAAVGFDDLRSLYRRAFQPENLIIAVVSPLAHDEVARLLSGLPTAGGQPEALPPLPLTTAPLRLTASLGGSLGAVRVGAVRRVAAADEPALELLVDVLSDRLQMDLRETRGLGYSVGAAFELAAADRGVFTAWVSPPRARLAEAEEALNGDLRAFDAASITQDELDKARSARQGRLLMRRLDSISRAYYLAMSELDTGGLDAYRHGLDAYDGVTLADLRRVASFFSELPLVTVVVD